MDMVYLDFDVIGLSQDAGILELFQLDGRCGSIVFLDGEEIIGFKYVDYLIQGDIPVLRGEIEVFRKS